MSRFFWIGLLTLLVIGTEPGVAQMSLDPLLGGHILGNSAEMVVLARPDTSTVLHKIIGDFFPAPAGIADAAQAGYPAGSSFDIATADVDANGREESITAWRGSDGAPVLSVCRFTKKPIVEETRVTTALTGALLPQGGAMRIVRASLDGDAADELVMAYRTVDQHVRVMVINVDSLTLTPLVASSIADVAQADSLGVNALFDIAAGDFDTDGLDEIFLVNVRLPETFVRIGYYHCSTRLLCTVYDGGGDGTALTSRVAGAFDLAGGNLPATPNYWYDLRVGGLSAAAGDLVGSGQDQPVICLLDGVVTSASAPTGYVFKELLIQQFHVSADLTTLTTESNIVQVESLAPFVTNSTAWSGSPASIAVEDLNGDGVDEIAVAGLEKVSVCYRNSGGYIAIFSSVPLPVLSTSILPAALVLFPSHRAVAIADVDAGVGASRWNPEVLYAYAGMYLVAQVPVGKVARALMYGVVRVESDPSTHQLTSLQNLGSVTTMSVNTSGTIGYAMAAGDIDGDGVRLGAPRHIYRENIMQPVVVLNGVPTHFDRFSGTNFDICDSYGAAESEFSATYQAASSQTAEFSTEVKSDWGFTSTVRAGGSFLGIGAEAHLTAKYGSGLSKRQGTSRALSVSEAAFTRTDDLLCVTVSDNDYWEYPVYADGLKRGDFLIAVPHLHFHPTRWIEGKNLEALWYKPHHEVGNILSYSSETNFAVETDVDEMLHIFSSFQASQQTGKDWGIQFSDFMTATDEKTRTVGIEAGGSVSGWGVEASFEGHYDREEISTHTNTLTSDVGVNLHIGSINTGIGAVGYAVGPYTYWAKNGALVVDYTIEPARSPIVGIETWWDTRYGHLPDPALNLPWRLDNEKGIGTSASQARLTKSLLLSPSVVQTGGIDTITVRIDNFSLVPITRPVSVRFFVGDPAGGGIPIVGNGNLTEVRTTGTIAARGHQYVKMSWTVPDLPDTVQIYAVIDQEDSLAEIHAENNVGYAQLITLGGATGVEGREAGEPEEFKLLQNYPNPFNPSTIITFALPARGNVVLKVFDLLGREVATLIDGVMEQGQHIARFDGVHCATGVYFYRLQTASGSVVKKMALLR